MTAGGGARIGIATFRTSKDFHAACVAAIKHFRGTLKNLELPDYELTDGTHSIDLHKLLTPAEDRIGAR